MKIDFLTFLGIKALLAKTKYVRCIVILRSAYNQKMKEIDFSTCATFCLIVGRWKKVNISINFQMYKRGLEQEAMFSQLAKFTCPVEREKIVLSRLNILSTTNLFSGLLTLFSCNNTATIPLRKGINIKRFALTFCTAFSSKPRIWLFRDVHLTTTC